MKNEPLRARRRRDLQRMKAKARRVYPHDAQAKSANHLKTCSCWMCGNPRRYEQEPHVSERRADDVVCLQDIDQ